MKYIDGDKLKAEIERLNKENEELRKSGGSIGQEFLFGIGAGYADVFKIIASLQQEQPEVDLEKLGEIARHLIAVKDHEEDMRLDEGEWLLLERIGYPERFNAKKK